MRKSAPAIFLLLPALFSCNIFSPDENENVVARVGEEYLYQEDLDDFVFTDKEDSTEKVDSYIKSWVKEQLLLQKALDNLDGEQYNFDQQLKNYRNSLLIYAFENQLINQKLDTVISKGEYKKYYEENKKNFKLNEPVLKCMFVKHLNSAPKQDSVELWMKNTEDYLNKVEQYCTQFAVNCQLDTSVWISFDNIRELTIEPLDEDIYLKRGEQKISDSLQTIILKVFDIKNKDEVAPLSYIEKQVESIILNKRKIKLIAKAKEEIMEEATLKEKYEIYK